MRAENRHHLLHQSLKRTNVAFGGSLMKERKGRGSRPISTKDPIHFVLRSTKAKGALSMRHHSKIKQVNKLFYAICKEHGVKVFEYANVGNHLHFLAKLPNRQVYKRWIRKLAARIACLVMGTRRGSKGEGKFWDYRPFSRIVFGWKGFQITRDYVYLNQLEAIGIIFRSSIKLVCQNLKFANTT